MSEDQVWLAVFAVLWFACAIASVCSMANKDAFGSWWSGFLMGGASPFIAALIYGMATQWEAACQ